MQSKKNKLIILIPIILVVILGIILICQNNKLKYFKEVTNSTFNLIENISEKTKKIISDKAKMVSSSADFPWKPRI